MLSCALAKLNLWSSLWTAGFVSASVHTAFSAWNASVSLASSKLTQFLKPSWKAISSVKPSLVPWAEIHPLRATGYHLYPLHSDLPDPGIKPRCLVFQVDSLLSEPPGKPIHKGNNEQIIHTGVCGGGGVGNQNKSHLNYMKDAQFAHNQGSVFYVSIFELFILYWGTAVW